MGLWFEKEETLKGYYEMMWQILNKYGIPEAFYGDNRTIFEFRKLSEKSQTVDRDVHVNFRRMCRQLGIELITTSVSQAKGRIERLWGTLQSRLISELRLRGITAIEAANSYLPEFMADYNRRFAVKPDMESSLFAPAPSPKEIDFYLSVEFQRTADNGSSFGFEGGRHQLIDGTGSSPGSPQRPSSTYTSPDPGSVSPSSMAGFGPSSKSRKGNRRKSQSPWAGQNTSQARTIRGGGTY